MDARQKVIEILEEERFPFGPEEVWAMIRRHGIRVDGDLSAFIEDVVVEGVRRSLEAMERLSGNLGIRSLPPPRWKSLCEEGRCYRCAFMKRGT